VFGEGISADTEEAATKIRALISRIVVSPVETGFGLQLEGRLSALMQAPNLYPSMRIAASGGSVVAEGRYRLSPRHSSGSFSLAL